MASQEFFEDWWHKTYSPFFGNKLFEEAFKKVALDAFEAESYWSFPEWWSQLYHLKFGSMSVELRAKEIAIEAWALSVLEDVVS